MTESPLPEDRLDDRQSLPDQVATMLESSLKTDRRTAVLAMLALVGCKTNREEPPRDESPRKAAAEPPKPETTPPPPVDPDRPEFLDEDVVKLHGLALLLANNDTFDKYIFNAVTGNKDFAQSYGIQKGYPLRFADGSNFTMPYHCFMFKAFDERSNVHLPKRLGKASKNASVASFFRNVSKYRADRPKDLTAIKVIIVTSYELSFGIKLAPDDLEVVPDANGRIQNIRYKAANTKGLKVTTTIAAETEASKKDPERHEILATTEKDWALVDSNDELLFPPSIMKDQGIALPKSALAEKKVFSYKKEFKSQGKTISVEFDLPIDSILEEQKALFAQGRPQKFRLDSRTIVANPGWYIRENDTLVQELAKIITESFTTKRQKMQAILDFVHSYEYVPDSYGEAPRSALVSLICQGGDCEDSSILTLSLAKAIGIECIFIYFHGHVNIGCNLDEKGTALEWEGKNYEWVETTGGNNGYTVRIRHQDNKGRIVKTETQSRGWRIGEKPSELGEPLFVSKIDSQELTNIQ